MGARAGLLAQWQCNPLYGALGVSARPALRNGETSVRIRSRSYTDPGQGWRHAGPGVLESTRAAPLRSFSTDHAFRTKPDPDRLKTRDFAANRRYTSPKSILAMPVFLRREAIRLLEGSVQCLHLGTIGLAIPRVGAARDAASEFCAEIGLIGAAAEMAVSACLVQLSGPSVLVQESGMFKSASQVLDEFLTTLAHPTPSFDALTRGVSDVDSHLSGIATACRKFRLLATLRAGGLHAARAPSREVCVSLAQDVATFLQSLSSSTRLKPYLARIPRPPAYVIEPSALLTEVRKRIDRSQTVTERGSLALELFLVLPEVPKDMPDWLSAFERVSVAPKDSDVTFLLKTLENATPVSFRKSKQSGTPIAVVVEPSNPNAIPIAPQYLRTEFTKTPDRFYADVANANGRLTDGVLHLPPESFVKEIFAVGFEVSGILEKNQMLTAHQTWPFIVASLAVQGTPGPLWFLARRTADLSQLVAQMERARAIVRPFVKGRIAEMIPGLIALRDSTKVPRSGMWKDLLASGAQVEANRGALPKRVAMSESAGKRLPPHLESAVLALESTQGFVGPILLALGDKKAPFAGEVLGYWTRILAEAAGGTEDIPGLLAILRNGACVAGHSAAKKALRYIDFVDYGPQNVPD